ncbi:pseudouridine synthase [Spirochaetota bacterium]
MTVIKTHTVPDDIVEVRFSDYAREVFTGIPSRNGIKKAIKRGDLRIDGEACKTGTWIKPGQVIDLIHSDKNKPKVYLLNLDIIYEDEHLAVINKPAGIEVLGNKFKTVENALPHNIVPSTDENALTRPMTVHRIDMQTSGLLVIAKTAPAQIELGRQFEKRQVKKRYSAIVIGKADEHGQITKPIEGREAYTEFALIKNVRSLKNDWLSLVYLYPHTGRTHQLRIHMADSGFPILGDKIYGKEGTVLKGKGLFLSSVELSFTHPVKGVPVNVKVDEPKKFQTFLDREERRWGKYK